MFWGVLFVVYALNLNVGSSYTDLCFRGSMCGEWIQLIQLWDDRTAEHLNVRQSHADTHV